MMEMLKDDVLFSIVISYLDFESAFLFSKCTTKEIRNRIFSNEMMIDHTNNDNDNSVGNENDNKNSNEHDDYPSLPMMCYQSMWKETYLRHNFAPPTPMPIPLSSTSTSSSASSSAIASSNYYINLIQYKKALMQNLIFNKKKNKKKRMIKKKKQQNIVSTVTTASSESVSECVSSTLSFKHVLGVSNSYFHFIPITPTSTATAMT